MNPLDLKKPRRNPKASFEYAGDEMQVCRPLAFSFVACTKAPVNVLWAPWTVLAGSYAVFSGALALRLLLVAFNCVSQNALWLESGRKSYVQSLNPGLFLAVFLVCLEQSKKNCAA